MAERIAVRLQRDGVPLRKPTPGSVMLTPRQAATNALSVDVVLGDGAPVSDAEVGVALPGGQIVQATHDPNFLGTYTCLAPTGQLLRLWVAHRQHPPVVEHDLDASRNARVELGDAIGVSSAIFFSTTGYLPSVKGRFNPILDSHGRRYLYVGNASISGQSTQPVQFECGVPFEVEDADGSVTVVTIIDVTSHGSVLEYEPPRNP